jgi:ABC-type branched-subunit amino acid transport system substrate-binding protein
LLLQCPLSQALAQDAAKNEIVLGYSASLTGKFATEATVVGRAYELWTEDVKKASGIRLKDRKLRVKLVRYDDGSDANAVIRDYERLITGHAVDLVVVKRGGKLQQVD